MQEGETALMHAVRQNRAGVVAHLVELGADLNTINNVSEGFWHAPYRCCRLIPI